MFARCPASNDGARITIARIIGAIGAIGAVGGVTGTVFISAADLTAIRLEALTGGFRLTGDPTAPGIERVGGARLITASLPAGMAIVCQSSYIALAIRRDADVDFSGDAKFTIDAVAARVTSRVDYAPSDTAAFFVLKPS